MNRDRTATHPAEALATRALLLVAHPDDETIGLGGHLHAMADLTIVHLTDGAPRDPKYARDAGLNSVHEYANTRREELDRAMSIAGVPASRRRCFGIVDQEVPLHLEHATRRVEELCIELRTRVVLTHAYEGGHPDHDAAAFVAHAARRRLGVLTVLEMPYYHRKDGHLRTGVFRDAIGTEHAVSLGADALARKRAMLACFETQRAVLEPFDPTVERFRVAPSYDFREPPHPGELHDEASSFGMGGAELRMLYRRASRALGIDLEDTR